MKHQLVADSSWRGCYSGLDCGEFNDCRSSYYSDWLEDVHEDLYRAALAATAGQVLLGGFRMNEQTSFKTSEIKIKDP